MNFLNHLTICRELFTTFRTQYSEGFMLMEDLKSYLDQLQGKGVERAQRLRNKGFHHSTNHDTNDGYNSNQNSPRDEKVTKQTTNNLTLPMTSSSAEYQEYVSLYNFDARENEINLKEGDIIFVYNKQDPDWWLGCTKREKKLGYFPSGYCNPKNFNNIDHTPHINETEAIYDYAGGEGELSFFKGDVLLIKQITQDGWWLGFNTRSKQTGRFPCNYSKAGRVS
jgi:hypothetical protein